MFDWAPFVGPFVFPLSSTKRNGSVTTIATYNAFIQNLAAAGHTDIQAYSSGFRVVGCTAAVDARDNTSTTGTGVPIYWLGGNKVADNYADFYDGSWDDEANDKNESGTDGPDTSQLSNYPLTGCHHDGTERIIFDSFALGASGTLGSNVGRPNSSGSGHGPLESGFSTKTGTRPMYGLSAVFQVAASAQNATGAPGITGTATVGQTLTATVGDIADPQGLPRSFLSSATTTIQWIQVDGGTDSDISGAMAGTYTPVTADEGKQIKVKVDFTDDDGFPESLTSDAYPAGGTVLALDTIAPRVTSIVNHIPSSILTNADSLIWRVAFSEAVSNVDATDFALRRTTATVTAVGAVSGATGAYDVTASGGNLASLNNIVTLYFAGGHDIEDVAGNALTNTTPTGSNFNQYEVDNMSPTATITDVPSTSSAPFTGTFSFSEAVTGFVVGDITLGNAVAASFMSATSSLYTALITPTADGTVTVDVAANSAQDLAGNGNTAATRASSTYTAGVVNNPPTVATAIPDQTAPAGTAFSYAFPANTFSDADSDALSYTATKADGTALPTWLTFAASTRTFSGTPQAADTGTVSVKVTASDGNGGSVSDEFDITVSAAADTTPPRVTSIVNHIPSSIETNADSLIWRVAFSEAVSNVDAADFAVTGTIATVTAVGAVSGATGAYDVTASGGNLASLNNIVTLYFAGGHDIEDVAGNALTNTTPTGSNFNQYEVDNMSPTATITDVPSTSSAPFTGTFSFSEAVTGFVVGDITLGNAVAASFMSATSSLYTALITPTADGTVTVDVAANSAQDLAGNGNTAATRASSTYTAGVVNNPPTVATAIPDQTAPAGTAFSYAFPANTFSDADSDALSYTATKADGTALPTWLTFAASTRTFSGTPQAADTGTVSVKVTASDGNGGSVSDEFDITVSAAADTTPPRVTSIVNHIPSSIETNADSLIWRVAFSEAVSNVDAADFAVTGTIATVTAVGAVSGATGAYDVTASGGDLASRNSVVSLYFG